MATRKRYNNRFKAQVVLEAIKSQRTIAEIASESGVPCQSDNQMETAVIGRTSWDLLY